LLLRSYGHITTLARAMKTGVDSIPGCEAVILRVAETLPEEVLTKMHAAPPPDDIPVLDPRDLPKYDGFLFGFPTRFGMMAAQMKAMFDATGQLWQAGALVGKPAGVFVSVATQGGGMETTAMTAVTQLTHHGMLFVPPGYSAGERIAVSGCPGGWG
jgi:NAD(P)H dehydrogenase (quinone)